MRTRSARRRGDDRTREDEAGSERETQSLCYAQFHILTLSILLRADPPAHFPAEPRRRRAPVSGNRRVSGGRYSILEGTSVSSHYFATGQRPFLQSIAPRSRSGRLGRRISRRDRSPSPYKPGGRALARRERRGECEWRPQILLAISSRRLFALRRDAGGNIE